MRATALQTPRSVKQEWGGGAKPEIPLQPMEVHGGAEFHLQPVEEPMPEQVDAPKEGCKPLGLFLVYFGISSLDINDIPQISRRMLSMPWEQLRKFEASKLPHFWLFSADLCGLCYESEWEASG